MGHVMLPQARIRTTESEPIYENDPKYGPIKHKIRPETIPGSVIATSSSVRRRRRRREREAASRMLCSLPVFTGDQTYFLH